MASSVDNLKALRPQLEAIYENLPRLRLDTGTRPPIIDISSEFEQAPVDDEDDSTASTSVSASGKSSPTGSSDTSGKKANECAKDQITTRHPHQQALSGIPGLRILRENVRHDIEQIDKFLARYATHRSKANPSSFSTNAPYLIAVWNELTRAQLPVVSVDKTFSAPNAKQDGKASKKGVVGVKVDVVADNGRHWIRVNTIKNSRLLSEFRELDSYLTKSESEGEDKSNVDCTCTSPCRKKPAPGELDNSLLQMGKALVSTAQSPARLSSGEISPSKVTLRLTRLLLDAKSLAHLESLGLKIVGPRHRSTTPDLSGTDARISQTIRELLKMGLEVQLGEHAFEVPSDLLATSKKPEPQPVPSRQINLDLSVLIALISDITHAPLPSSTEEAYTRYIPTPAQRTRSRRRRQRQKELLALSKTRDDTKKSQGLATNKRKEPRIVEAKESDDEGESVHSRALANQVLREMNTALVDEIVGGLELPLGTNSDASPPIEFWTSKEIRDRCLRIVEKIGGPAEKRRASALFFDPCVPHEPVLGIRYASVEEAAKAYWSDSRHPHDAVPGLARVRIFDDKGDHMQGTGSAENITAALSHSNPFWVDLEGSCNRLLTQGETAHRRALPSVVTGTENSDFKDVALTDEIERAAVTRSNPRLTAHTVGTLYRGVSRGWTTLTANRTSVREMLKESAKEARSHAPLRLSLENDEAREFTVAAIWVVEPRSLAESMRGDFVPAGMPDCFQSLDRGGDN